MKNFEIVEKGSNGVHPIAKCPNCSQKMRTHHLKEHLPKCRGDDRKYFCPSCKKGLHERAVRRHLKSKHSELSNIPICDLWLEAVSKFPGWKFALAKKHAYEEEYHKTEETLEICPECSQKTFGLEQHLKCAHQQPVAIEEKENSESPNIHVQTNMLKIPAFSIGSINSEQEDQKKIESLTLGFESVQLSASTLEKEEKKKEVEIEEPQIDEINEKINGEKYSNSSRIFEEKGELIPFSRHGHYKLTPSPIFEEKNEIIPDLEDENENYEKNPIYSETFPSQIKAYKITKLSPNDSEIVDEYRQKELILHYAIDESVIAGKYLFPKQKTRTPTTLTKHVNTERLEIEEEKNRKYIHAFIRCNMCRSFQLEGTPLMEYAAGPSGIPLLKCKICEPLEYEYLFFLTKQIEHHNSLENYIHYVENNHETTQGVKKKELGRIQEFRQKYDHLFSKVTIDYDFPIRRLPIGSDWTIREYTNIKDAFKICGNFKFMNPLPSPNVVQKGMKVMFDRRRTYRANIELKAFPTELFLAEENNFEARIRKDFGVNAYSDDYWFSDQLPEKVYTSHHYRPSESLIKHMKILKKKHRHLPLEIKESKIPKAGNGVFALKRIPANTILMFYVGVQMSVFEHWPSSDSVYDIGMIQTGEENYYDGTRELIPLVIEPVQKLNAARYINTSDNPNCFIIQVYFDGVIGLLIATSREPNPGEELTYKYGDNYGFSDEFGIKDKSGIYSQFLRDPKKIRYTAGIKKNLEIWIQSIKTGESPTKVKKEWKGHESEEDEAIEVEEIKDEEIKADAISGSVEIPETNKQQIPRIFGIIDIANDKPLFSELFSVKEQHRVDEKCEPSLIDQIKEESEKMILEGLEGDVEDGNDDNNDDDVKSQLSIREHKIIIKNMSSSKSTHSRREIKKVDEEEKLILKLSMVERFNSMTVESFKKINKDDLAFMYKNFSRSKYNKYRHQFPRMRESELVSKIIKEWEADDKWTIHRYCIEHNVYRWDNEEESENGDTRSPGRTPKKNNIIKKYKTPSKRGVRVFIVESSAENAYEHAYISSEDEIKSLVDDEVHRQRVQKHEADLFFESILTISFEIDVFVTECLRICSDLTKEIDILKENAMFLDVSEWFFKDHGVKQGRKRGVNILKCKVCNETCDVLRGVFHLKAEHRRMYLSALIYQYYVQNKKSYVHVRCRNSEAVDYRKWELVEVVVTKKSKLAISKRFSEEMPQNKRDMCNMLVEVNNESRNVYNNRMRVIEKWDIPFDERTADIELSDIDSIAPEDEPMISELNLEVDPQLEDIKEILKKHEGDIFKIEFNEKVHVDANEILNSFRYGIDCAYIFERSDKNRIIINPGRFKTKTKKSEKKLKISEKKVTESGSRIEVLAKEDEIHEKKSPSQKKIECIEKSSNSFEDIYLNHQFEIGNVQKFRYGRCPNCFCFFENEKERNHEQECWNKIKTCLDCGIRYETLCGKHICRDQFFINVFPEYSDILVVKDMGLSDHFSKQVQRLSNSSFTSKFAPLTQEKIAEPSESQLLKLNPHFESEEDPKIHHKKKKKKVPLDYESSHQRYNRTIEKLKMGKDFCIPGLSNLQALELLTDERNEVERLLHKDCCCICYTSMSPHVSLFHDQIMRMNKFDLREIFRLNLCNLPSEKIMQDHLLLANHMALIICERCKSTLHAECWISIVESHLKSLRTTQPQCPYCRAPEIFVKRAETKIFNGNECEKYLSSKRYEIELIFKEAEKWDIEQSNQSKESEKG